MGWFSATKVTPVSQKNIANWQKLFEKRYAWDEITEVDNRPGITAQTAQCRNGRHCKYGKHCHFSHTETAKDKFDAFRDTLFREKPNSSNFICEHGPHMGYSDNLWDEITSVLEHVRDNAIEKESNGYCGERCEDYVLIPHGSIPALLNIYSSCTGTYPHTTHFEK
jgi:hypothetical protein